MKKQLTKKYSSLLLTVLFALFFLQSCTAQKTNDFSGVNTDLRKVNLKGNVKSIRDMYHPKTAFDNNKYHNDLYPVFLGYADFDEKGMFLKTTSFFFMDSIDGSVDEKFITCYKSHKDDVVKKSKYHPLINIPFPAYNPYLLNLNIYSWRENKDWDFNEHPIPEELVQVIYIYEFNEQNRIKQQLEYIPFQETLAVEKKQIKNLKDIYSRIIYKYDIKGRLIEQKIIARENVPKEVPFYEYDAHGLLFSIRNDFKRTFNYNDKDQLTNVTFLVNNDVAYSEAYSYHPNENYIVQVECFSISDTATGIKRGKTITKYDKDGNVIEAISLPEKEGQLPKTRYYEYTLDAYNNWIECRMFLEGKTPKPTVIAKRIIEYYKN